MFPCKWTPKILRVAALFCIVSSQSAWADIYHWIDPATGQLNISNTAPEGGAVNPQVFKSEERDDVDKPSSNASPSDDPNGNNLPVVVIKKQQRNRIENQQSSTKKAPSNQRVKIQPLPNSKGALGKKAIPTDQEIIKINLCSTLRDRIKQLDLRLSTDLSDNEMDKTIIKLQRYARHLKKNCKHY